VGDLGDANTEQLEAIRKAVLDAVEAYALAGESIPEDLRAIAAATGTAIDANRELINAAREGAREVRELITNVGGLQAANATQIDAIKESIQKALDAYELAGERIPDDLKAIAKQLGVVSTAAEEAAKKLKTVVDGLAASLKTLRDAAKADDPAAGLLSQRADLAEELARIQAKTNPTSEEIDRAFELKGILFGLDSELGKIERSGPAAAVGLDQVQAAIREFIKAAGPGVSQLSEVQREVIGNALEGLQALASTGGVTAQTIQAVFKNLADDLRGFGVDVTSLDEALADTGGTIRNIAELLRKQGIEADGSLRAQVEGYQQLDQAGQERIDRLEIERKFEQKVQEERLEALEELTVKTEEGVDRIVAAWRLARAECEEYRACVEATAEAH
jgi:ABC-type transporter Mla subunit MlaD